MNTHYEITGLSHDGRGITHINGKTCFVQAALPGDTVTLKVRHEERNFMEADLLTIEQPSAQRVQPFCNKYDICGGCQLQHLAVEAQHRFKADNFFTELKQQVNTETCEFVETLTASTIGYRRRARLALEIDKKDKQARFGFRRAQDSRLVDIDHCPVLTDKLNVAIAQARPGLLAKASRKTHEFTLVDVDNGIFGLTEPDEQPVYRIQRETELKLQFPQDGFIQVNAEINQQMIQQAIDWLELNPQHNVIDFFCGVGNFTLPMAQIAKQALGVEGLPELVAAAQQNATSNQLTNCQFEKADLFKGLEHLNWYREQKYDRILLDPGRLGAAELCQHLGQLDAQKIVYVSCNAATLIRDIKLLQKQGYQLTKAGAMDMFPHTTHLEVMVLLEKGQKVKKQKAQRLASKKRVFKF
ncbi:23S rRNA (uracil(1939)-C(5))-methyltransferase RlmD [Thiosulfatimonas sediminis]|uniref:23S rRNA (Uracil(1939)-C(5))-methyltransferase RlmD n=1 Tax=Thiosulfatimonas sediminis TaxID=2675054 RepID=A0A6F8PWP1_9GAMM|nr:23S rRNA (uracil(1939)-C(5))-methyltransferase RlmD [Thiosulfatimonas sediminis]BBP46390.1 23S rRNA (uracil(1939)-C(5))-methyltransferase RlmD [Thiosulfatimonas sediminis]